MNSELREKLISIAKKEITDTDPSHDIHHALRTLKLAEILAKEENADLDIIVPAALFHDIVNHPKISLKAKDSPKESALKTRKILNSLKEYPQEKILKVEYCIETCFFDNDAKPSTIEAMVLHDADHLESTGVISIMRTFSSTGQYRRPFVDPNDPFCRNREPNPRGFAVDLFFTRLLKAKNKMHTKLAKKIAERRTKVLKTFLEELDMELDGK